MEESLGKKNHKIEFDEAALRDLKKLPKQV